MYDLKLVTNDGKFLLGKLYSEYVQLRKNKVPKDEAMYFSDPEYIQKKFMKEWILEDVITTCLELHKKGFLNGVPASNSLLSISITSEAIAILEESFGDKVEKALEWASKIKSAIPFV